MVRIFNPLAGAAQPEIELKHIQPAPVGYQPLALKDQPACPHCRGVHIYQSKNLIQCHSCGYKAGTAAGRWVQI